MKREITCRHYWILQATHKYLDIFWCRKCGKLKNISFDDDNRKVSTYYNTPQSSIAKEPTQ